MRQREQSYTFISFYTYAHREGYTITMAKTSCDRRAPEYSTGTSTIH